MRGQHDNRPHRTADADLERLKQHIKSFPRCQSHYSRHKNPHKRFLSPELDIRKMYNLYKVRCTADGVSFLSEDNRRTFREDFNLGFGVPKSDSCKVCDSTKVTLDAETDEVKRQQITVQWELHKRKAETAFKLKH